MRRSDTDWFDQHLAPEFMNGNPDGSLVDRLAFLAQIARPCAVSDFAAEDVRIRLFGTIAILHGCTVYKKPSGEAGKGRYTDVWMRRQGGWLCVSADVTRG